VLSQVPPPPAERPAPRPDGWPGPVPVLPVRLWQEGAFLFAASTPSDPDHHLRLLEQGAGTGWQWLPLVGPDFPFSTYAQRGPLVAWTPHLAGVALKLDRKAEGSTTTAAPRARRGRLLTAFLVVLLLGLLGGNLCYLRDIQQRLAAAPAPAPSAGAAPEPPPRRVVRPAREPQDESRERFVAALHRLLVEKGGEGELRADRAALLERYEELARRNKDLRVREGDERGKLTVAAVAVLAGRSADRIEATVRKALAGKYDPKLINVACEHVREQFAAQGKEGP
jgi:hypothetical protein